MVEFSRRCVFQFLRPQRGSEFEVREGGPKATPFAEEVKRVNLSSTEKPTERTSISPSI
jgi:hypothetical protein